ncbi:sugar phosphate isomerase/epimerase (plasmid) [Sinorhizobium meliloti]|uniref:sugar phosphate isomerase/epimerase family protein n=1 Tax=Sinorhizobium TaxID=28105 RepID=UPI00119DF06A|nr:sugar phosphate isomerase/epimerase [Sinorhizobium medicae]MDX0009844.1 TIM barrel protein [Sinorhizobium meliloti]MDX0227304.1 TIM barrel protein [Sinorhizobium meliloti]TWA26368.1 sugar phosphate isomerase/epimerase [Sinorhizobium medicae]
MKIAISEITTLRADLETDVAAFAATGWTAFELSLEKAGRYLESHSLTDLKALLAEKNLKPVAAIGLAPTGPGLFLARGADFEAYLASFRRQIEMCRVLGIACIGIGADPARGVTGDGWIEGAVANTRIAANIARENGVAIGIEALSLSPPIGPFLLAGLNETRAFVERVGHPAVGINFDVFHFIRSGGTVADIAAVKPGQVLHAHICDLPQMPAENWEDSHRVMPGDGDLPLTAIRGALVSRGYDGYWALELLNEDYWARDAADVARIGKASMERFLG